MSKQAKILIGLATIWPLIYMFIFFGFVLIAVLTTSQHAPGKFDAEDGFPISFAWLFGLHILTMIWIMGLLIFYIVNVFKNERVEKDKKVLWAIVLFMGGIIAMPVYWYLYIWKEKGEA